MKWIELGNSKMGTKKIRKDNLVFKYEFKCDYCGDNYKTNSSRHNNCFNPVCITNQKVG